MKKTIPSDVWETKKALIAKLYKDEEWPLKQVIKQIRTDDFNPSETQLRSRLKKWRVTKPSRQARKKVIDDPPDHSGESSGSGDPSPGIPPEPFVRSDTARRGRSSPSSCKLHNRSAKSPQQPESCHAARVEKRLSSPCKEAPRMTLERAFSPSKINHHPRGHQTGANSGVSPPFSQLSPSTAPAAANPQELLSLGPVAGQIPAAPLLGSPTYTASGYTMSPDISGASSPADMWTESTTSAPLLGWPAVIDPVDIGSTYTYGATPLWYPIADGSNGHHHSTALSLPPPMAGYYPPLHPLADPVSYSSQSQTSLEGSRHRGMEETDESLRAWKRAPSSSTESEADSAFVPHAHPYSSAHKICSAGGTPQFKYPPPSAAGSWAQHSPYGFATPYAMMCAPPYTFSGQQEPFVQQRSRVSL